jgi:hypothetical protein
MSERDDIEFDFFEESDTRETPEERPRRGPRPPVRPPTGLTPLLRLIGLISFAILIVLLLVLWVNGCREDKRKDAYRHYVEKVADYGQQSQRLGRSFNTLLTTRGTKESDVESELSGLARQQEQIASAARGLDPPGHLRAADAHMLDALDLRTNGLRGMTDAFRSTASSKNANTAGSMVSLWKRIHGAATGGSNCSPRGTGIVSTKALPSGKELSADTLNTIPLSSDLVFQVTVKNSGCAQEVGLKVTLTIQQSPKPIKSRKTIPLIDPGNEESVSFSGLGLPPLDQRTSLTIEVDPVPGETNTSNNSANYPVQFSVS